LPAGEVLPSIHTVVELPLNKNVEDRIQIFILKLAAKKYKRNTPNFHNKGMPYKVENNEK
jgi:hypothetical protein